jgi:hypothetical protein
VQRQGQEESTRAGARTAARQQEAFQTAVAEVVGVVAAGGRAAAMVGVGEHVEAV